MLVGAENALCFNGYFQILSFLVVVMFSLLYKFFVSRESHFFINILLLFKKIFFKNGLLHVLYG